MRLLVLAAILWPLVGCTTEPAVQRGADRRAIAERNRRNVEELSTDMTREEVTRIMGEGEPGDEVETPYKTESVSVSPDFSATRVFYVTHDSGGAVVADDLTAAVFVEGRLLGLGDRALRELDILSVVGWEPPGFQPLPDELPGAFGRVVDVRNQRIIVLLAALSPRLKHLGASLAVYADNRYKGEAVVVGILGVYRSFLGCRFEPAPAAPGVEVGDRASVYVR